MRELFDRLSPTLQSIASKLTSDLELQKDVAQEMRFHLWQIEKERPNKTLSWYSQNCYQHGRDFLKRGRSIDGKVRSSVERLSLSQQGSDEGGESLLLPFLDEFENEVAIMDIVTRIQNELTQKQRRILDFLMQGYTELEIGLMTSVSRQSIHQQKKRIQQIAKGILLLT